MYIQIKVEHARSSCRICPPTNGRWLLITTLIFKQTEISHVDTINKFTKYVFSKIRFRQIQTV